MHVVSTNQIADIFHFNDNRWYFQNNWNYYNITINCNNIIIRIRFNHHFFNPAFRLLVTIQTYGKSKNNCRTWLWSWYRLFSRNSKFSKYWVICSKYLVFQIQDVGNLVSQYIWLEIPSILIEIQGSRSKYYWDWSAMFFIWNIRYFENMW